MANITSSIKEFARQFPEKAAIVTNGETLSYKEWYSLVAKTANWLQSMPFSDKRIGFIMLNGIPFLQLFAGASMAEWTAVPLDAKWKAEELKKRLEISNPSVLVTSKDFYRHIAPYHPCVLIWEDCLAEIHEKNENIHIESHNNPPFYMGFTSGTTGNPKAFIRSHKSWAASFLVNQHDFHMNQEDHVLIPGSLIHSHFLYGAVSTLCTGGTVHLLEKFSAAKSLSLLEARSITTFYVVPTMVSAILKENRIIEKPIKILSSGAKWDEQSKAEIRRAFPQLSMIEFYGASELSYVTCLAGGSKADSVGKPCFGVEIQIRGTNGEQLEPYKIGKIYVKSDLIFDGYLYPGTQTAEGIRDENGWATVDDMGYVDDDGFLYISGREKNMILYGGINIFPEEIEKVILQHPAVEEAAVIGLNDPYWGQMAAAVIKGKASALELKRLCKNHLAAYKIPRKWFFLDQMPYTTSGKIARAQLKDSIESKVTSY